MLLDTVHSMKQTTNIKGKKMKTRQEVMENPAVHNLTKQILELCNDKDVVDRVYDIEIALEVVKAEMNEALGR